MSEQTPEQQEYSILLKDALDLRNSGRPEEALQVLEKMGELDNHLSLYEARMMCLGDLRRYEEAIRVANDGIGSLDWHASLVRRKGEMYLAMRKYDEALACFDDAEDIWRASPHRIYMPEMMLILGFKGTVLGIMDSMEGGR